MQALKFQRQWQWLPLCGLALWLTLSVSQGAMGAQTTVSVTPPSSAQMIRKRHSESTTLGALSDQDSQLSIAPPIPRQRRKTQQVRSVLIVRMVNRPEDTVTASTTNSKLMQVIFDGTHDEPASVRRQLELCSGGRLRLEPAPYGILSVSVSLPPGLDRNIEAWKDAAATAVMQSHFASQRRTDGSATDLEQLRGMADHVILILPPSFPNDDFVANAEILSSISIFTIVWSESLSSFMHELGHNLGLRHAGLANGDVYGDTSGNMGFSEPVMWSPQKCYNAAQHWDLGWFDDHQFSLVESSSSPVALPMRLQVAAFVDRHKIGADMVILVQIRQDIFLQFNRAKDYNIGTDMYVDQVVVVQSLDDATRIVAGMDPNGNSVLPISPGLDLRVCEIVIQDDPNQIDYAVIAFGSDDGTGSLCGASGPVMVQQQSQQPPEQQQQQPVQQPEQPVIPTQQQQQLPPPPPPPPPPLPQPLPQPMPIVPQMPPPPQEDPVQSDVVLQFPAPIPATVRPPTPVGTPPQVDQQVMRTFAPVLPQMVQTVVAPVPTPVAVAATTAPTIEEQITWEPSTSTPSASFGAGAIATHRPTAAIHHLEPEQVSEARWPTVGGTGPRPAPTLDPWGVFSESASVDGQATTTTTQTSYTPATSTSGFTSPVAIGGYILVAALVAVLAVVVTWRFKKRGANSALLDDDDHENAARIPSSQPWLPIYSNDLNDVEVDSNKRKQRNSTHTAETAGFDEDDDDDMWPGFFDWSQKSSFNFWGTDEAATSRQK